MAREGQEMLIRSQDKKMIANLSNIDVIELFEWKGKIHVTRGNGALIRCFGVYSTEEKAIKVLDMIQDRHDCLNMYHNAPQDGYVQSVFQMPQDDEVKP